MRSIVKFFTPVKVAGLLAAFVVMALAPHDAEARNPKFMPVPDLLAAAEGGAPAAQYYLGLRYETGDGLPQDYKRAAQWYEASATQGQVQAIFEMAMLNAMGRFTQHSQTAADQSRAWFDKLEGAGVVIDNKYFIRRDGIERKDVSDAAARIDWLRRTSESGHRLAQRYLGYQYDMGKLGGTPNCGEAARWYEKAALQGDVYSQERMGMLSVACNAFPADEARSAYWFRKAAEQGNIGAQISISAAYRFGKGVERDETLAAYWMAQAAEGGSAVAQKYIGDRYLEGNGVPRDRALALSWYEKSAAQGYDRGIAARDAMLRQSGAATPSAVETVAMLAALWVAFEAIDDITRPEAEPSPHSSFVTEAINQCRNEVHRRMVRCYSSMTIPGCTMTGQCTYEWTCQTGNKGRGKCSPRGRYTDEHVDYYCDPLVGDKYSKKDNVYDASCH